MAEGSEGRGTETLLSKGEQEEEGREGRGRRGAGGRGGCVGPGVLNSENNESIHSQPSLIGRLI